jgi:hypothetical protein
MASHPASATELLTLDPCAAADPTRERSERADAALDLHEGISTPTCARWPKALRLVSSAGHFVPGRCKATNLCDYCAKLAAVENAEMLSLDALNGNAPAVYVVLTTPSADPRPQVYYESRRKLQKAIKRRFPAAEFATLVEFTTGYAEHAGGLRRPHWNVLVKGVQAGDAAVIRTLVESVWCPRVGASAKAQYVAPVGDVGGIVGYLALHFQKAEQTPPRGWKGHRFSYSRGYFGRPAWRVRGEAQRALAVKRELWKVEQDGMGLGEALTVAELRVTVAESVRWEAVVIGVDTASGVIGKARRLDGSEPTVMRLTKARALLSRPDRRR